MYELSERDFEYLKLSANEQIYINMLLKHAYQRWYNDCVDEFKNSIYNK